MDCCKMSISIIEVVTFVWCPLSLLTGWLIMELSGWHCGKSERGKIWKWWQLFHQDYYFIQRVFKRISIQFILIQNKRKPPGSSAAAVNVCGCIWVEGGIQFYIHLRPDTWWNILSQSPEYPLLSPCQISASDGYYKKHV